MFVELDKLGAKGVMMFEKTLGYIFVGFQFVVILIWAITAPISVVPWWLTVTLCAASWVCGAVVILAIEDDD